MKRVWLIIAMCSVTLGLFAETREDFSTRRNELRVGWGDQLFESLMWHNPVQIATTLPETYTAVYHENYRHNQHIWAEYLWRFNYWFALGGMVDVSEVGWNDVTRNGQGTEIMRSKRKYFYNCVIMPNMRFTYFHHPNVNIYSSLGIGMDINGGTETNARGKKTDIGLAVNGTVVGVSANYDRWFMAVDLGGLTALKDKNTIFLAFSRMINVSIGVRF